MKSTYTLTMTHFHWTAPYQTPYVGGEGGSGGLVGNFLAAISQKMGYLVWLVRFMVAFHCNITFLLARRVRQVFSPLRSFPSHVTWWCPGIDTDTKAKLQVEGLKGALLKFWLILINLIKTWGLATSPKQSPLYFKPAERHSIFICKTLTHSTCRLTSHISETELFSTK